MIIKQSLFLAALFFLTSSSNAFSSDSTSPADCTTVDLRTEYPLKMRNQGGVSWCYAHAAADYLQFYNRIPEQISASDIAINYNQRFWPRFLHWWKGGIVPQTGLIRNALYDADAEGYCSEEYFPSEKWTRRIMAGKNVGALEMVPLNTAFQDIDSMLAQISNGTYQKPGDLPFIYEFKGMTHQQFFDAVFANDSTGNALDQIRLSACADHRKPYAKTIADIRMSFNIGDSFSQINRQLNQHMPVSVDFFYGFLDDIDSYSKSLNELHTTLLIGRRFSAETQECQYLIKNSYGTDCAEYDHRHQCENGNVWVGEKSLDHAMTSMVYIAD